MAELFERFEVDREPRWPILLELTSASLVFHIVALACVIYIPGVRDALNIADMFSNVRYVDRAYTKSEIGEDVQLVQLSEKFHYPEGYFALEGALPQPNPAIELAPRTAFSIKPSMPQNSPTPTPEPTLEPSPSASPKASPKNSATANVAAETNSPSPETKSVVDAEQKLNDIAAENSVVRPGDKDINTRPLKDWLARANELKVRGDVDLTANVEITIAANLNPNCKLSDAVVIQKSGDARLISIARDMVAAIGDSGMLSFLRDPKKVKDTDQLQCDALPLQLTVKLDQNEIRATVESQADTPERAAQMARGYNGLLMVGQLAKRGHDEEMIYKSTKVTSEGKQIVVSFTMPRQTAGEMLKKQLPSS